MRGMSFWLSIVENVARSLLAQGSVVSRPFCNSNGRPASQHTERHSSRLTNRWASTITLLLWKFYDRLTILDGIVHNQLQSYTDHFELLDSSQFSFRPHLSTFRVVSNTLQFIYNNLDNGSVVVSLSLDFAKALYCVDHEILLKKLSTYGMRRFASKWFKSYLSDRKKTVSLNGHNFQFCPSNFGVPQGSIHSSHFFLICINDFPKCLNFSNFIRYADDGTLTNV